MSEADHSKVVSKNRLVQLLQKYLEMLPLRVNDSCVLLEEFSYEIRYSFFGLFEVFDQPELSGLFALLDSLREFLSSLL